MKSKLLLFIFLSATVLFSCKKDSQTDGDSSEAKKLTDIKVPEGFNWESSRDVQIQVKIADTRFGNSIHVLSVYDMEGKLLSKGSASLNSPFESKIYLPYTTKEIIILKTAPDNSTISEKVVLNSDRVSVTLDALTASSVSLLKNGNSVLAISPNCSSNCDQSVNLSQNSQWITISGGSTYCISGSNKTFNVTFGKDGGTLKICGSGLTIQNINKNSGSSAIEIIVTSGSSVTFSDLSLDKTYHTLKNYGSSTFSSSFSSSGVVTNYGTLTINSDYNVNSGDGVVHSNEGNLIVKGTLNVNSNTSYFNNGVGTVKNLQLNSNSIFDNNCKLTITDNFIADKTFNNYGYAAVFGKTQINSNGRINLFNGAIFTTKDLDKITGFLVGSGSTSLVKVTGTINQNLILDASQQPNSQKFKGAVQVCYTSNLPAGLFQEGASQGCSVYIAQTGCNPGNGAAPVSDSDGDGVSDNLDDYPNDNTKAFNNYYPSGNAEAGATIAFEDQWPVKGDYDMNDVVLSYSFRVITNAQNRVVEVDGTYNLQARGGVFQNGFGIEFPVSRSLVSDVNGGVLEEGQQKAVLVLFENMHKEMLYFNTRKEDPVMPAKAFPISFKVNNGPTLAEFGLGEYNPFIWNKASGRGFEIHLPGKTPTALADVRLFGTADDASNPSKNKYYVTAEGYPWALSVPEGSFNYPLEGKDIITAYLRLPEWISSGGKAYTDWYSNQGVGYRNTTNLFR